MNCIKCGKEITDGRRKICKECAEKEKKEKEESKAKEEKKSTSGKSNNSGKTTNNEGENKGTLAIAIATVVIIIALVVAIIITLCSSNNGMEKNVGNTIGNIRNYGYATINGNYIYYLAPNADSTAVGIFRVKKNGKGDTEQLYMDDTDMDIVSINVYKGNIYFIGVGTDEYTDDDDTDNKIYRMTTEGEDLTVINDNEFNNDCYEIYVVNGSLYYIGTDNNIYKMDLDGSNKTVVTENGTGYLGITEKYIIYNVEVESDEDTTYTTYLMNIDGTEQRPIIDGERLYSVNIEDNYVYYTNADKQICRTEIDSGESEILLDTTAYNMNLYDGYIYYLNYKDLDNEDYTVCLYRIKADGTETAATTIKEMDSYSSFIDVVGDWVIYMDSNDDEGFINIVKTDGSDEVRLYSLNYEDYYSTDESTSDEEDTDEATTEETTTDETTTTEETTNTNETTTNEVASSETTTNTVVNTTAETSTTNTTEATTSNTTATSENTVTANATAQ